MRQGKAFPWRRSGFILRDMRWIVREVAVWLALVQRLLVLVASLVTMTGRGFLLGHPAMLPTSKLYYACEKYPNSCDIDDDEFIPAHQYDPNDPPYCPKHRTAPMNTEVHLP
jgi:hypothetical protein